MASLSGYLVTDMNNIEQAQTDFNAVLKAHLAKDSSDPVKPRCALSVSFYHDTHMDFVAKAFEPVTGQLQRVNNSLIKICDTKDQALKLSQTLNAMVHDFNEATLKRPFYPEWLDDYFAVQSFGINYIGAKQDVLSIEDEEKRQNEKSNGDGESERYLSRRTFSKNNVLGYSLDALKADVTSFLMGSLIIPEGKTTDAEACIAAMFNDLMVAVKGKLALENHANQRLVWALSSKSFRMMESCALDTQEHLEEYRRSEARKQSAEAFREKNKLGFDVVRNGLQKRLSELLSEFQLSDTAATFTGLDVMYSSPFELSDFNKTYLEELAMHRYYPVSAAAADMLTDLFIEYFRIKTSAAHKAALTELSRKLSAEHFYADVIEGIYRELVL